MTRSERLQRINELVGEDSDLGSFSADRMEFSELIFLEIRDVLNEVHDMNASLRFWKLVAEDHLLAEVRRKDNLREKKWSGSPEMYAVVNFTNFPSRAEKVRNIGGHIVRNLKSRRNKHEIEQNVLQSDNVYVGFNGLPLPEEAGEKVASLQKYYPLIVGIGKKNKRQHLNRITGVYESLFMQNVIKRIPKVYVEYFHRLYNMVKVVDPKSKTLHVHRTDSLFETMMIAKYTEEGSKLIWYQHGCYYGEVIHKYRGYFEHSTGDLFRTWGYTDHAIDEPWSAYRLEAFKQKLVRNGADITNDLMICYAAIGSHNKKDVVKYTDTLLKKINKEKYAKILARPRPENDHVNASSQLDFIEDDRVTVAPDGSSVAKQVAESRIVLQMRVPSTNFLECIYCDQPVIGLLDNEQPTEIIKSYYEFFLEEGILHHNMHSAIDFLNGVDLDRWWVNIIRSPKYMAYKKEFANSDRFTNKVAI